MALSMGFFGEVINTGILLGAAIVIVGIAAFEWADMKHKAAASSSHAKSDEEVEFELINA